MGVLTSNDFVAFGDVWERVGRILGGQKRPSGLSLYLVRDLYGTVRISALQSAAENEEFSSYLKRLASVLHAKLGAYGCPPEEGLLFLDEAFFDALKAAARQVAPGVFRVERLVTGHEWGTSRDSRPSSDAQRWTLEVLEPVRSTGSGGRVGPAMSGLSAETARKAFRALPDETSYGEAPPSPDLVFLPPSHLKALDPDRQLVTGMRGAGKTFWWSALQEKPVRDLVRKHDARSTLRAETEVRTGFGARPASSEYPEGRRGGVRPTR